MFLTSFYKNRKNEKLWKFPLFQGFSPQQICILKWLISQWIVFIVYYQISIIILVYHSWLTRKRPISNETPSLEYRRVHLNFKSIWRMFRFSRNNLSTFTITSAARLPVFFDSHISLNFLFVELNLCQNIVYVYSYITRIFTSLLIDFLEIGNRKVLRKSQTFRL